MGADQSLPGRLAQEGKAPGFAIWLTGLPASGKTTLARALQEQLARQSIDTVILDSDELRRILTPQPTYRADERDWFYAVLAGLAGWLTGSGINVLIAATANRRTYRQAARAAIKRFAEIYVTCALETCQQRDRKGIYAAANAGQADHVPGLGSAYEPPLQPEVVIDSERLAPAEAASLVLLQLAGWLRAESPAP